MPSRVVRIAFLSFVVVVLVAGTAAAGTQHAATKAKPRTQRWSVSLTSQDRTLHQVGTSGERTYGWNRLVGSTSIDGNAAQIEMLGNVQYRSGSGPFFGFISVKQADGSVLGIRMDGRAAASPDGTDATFRAKLKVLGGTGAQAGTTGHGSFTGSRKAALGGTVDIDVTLALRG